MTIEEFREIKPEYKNVEGDALWDALTEYMLGQQAADEILKTTMPIWKTHTLRWLYYRRVPNMPFRSYKKDKYASNTRCSSCKNGVSSRIGFLFRQEDGTQKYTSYCPHCKEEYQEEPNTNITHRLYVIGVWVSKLFWSILDGLHLVRSSFHGRYEMFGDESRYVKAWHLDTETCATTHILRNRKWWEHIFIEKSKHNF
jgi:hypothetical protein